MNKTLQLFSHLSLSHPPPLMTSDFFFFFGLILEIFAKFLLWHNGIGSISAALGHRFHLGLVQWVKRSGVDVTVA